MCRSIPRARQTPGQKDEIIDRRQRSAALIATATAIPVVVVLAFVFSAGRSGSGHSADAPTPEPSATVTITPPPSPTNAIATACTTVIAGLPVQLGTLNARKYDSNSSFVAAWGNPAVILRCGVPRVSLALTSSSDPGIQAVYAKAGDASTIVNWQLSLGKTSATYTSVDRGATVVEVTVPSGQSPGDLMPIISAAVDQLPATCVTYDEASGATSSTKPICDGTN